MLGLLWFFTSHVRLSLSPMGVTLRLGEERFVAWSEIAQAEALPWFHPRGGAPFLPGIRLRGRDAVLLLDIPDVFDEARKTIAARITAGRSHGKGDGVDRVQG